MEKFKDILDNIDKMSVLELNELVKAIEEKFGVSATVVSPAPQAGISAGADEEKEAYTVHLVSSGEQKIAVMKVVKESFGLGLKDAKDMVDKAPVDLKLNVKKAEAEDLKKKLEEAGASVVLK